MFSSCLYIIVFCILFQNGIEYLKWKEKQEFYNGNIVVQSVRQQYKTVCFVST
ncbi:hypothetical protein AsAng_0035680 [Aureispira anguillae]|uniref:Uncharacterized protein n=1 Tax=Aureispira anguillae TaxID=2864201 RepID=A0A915YH48_9BACT|nr:hypothetical protein AsAng_0035680 [Aureispira anguillae]